MKPGDGLPAQALFTGCGGGTEIGGAMRRALDLVIENPGALKKADIVLVTDGAADTGSAARLREQAGQLGVTILGVGISITQDALVPWCDQYAVIDQLDTIDRTAEQVFTV